MARGAVHLFNLGRGQYGQRTVVCGNKRYCDATFVAKHVTCKSCRAYRAWAERYQEQSPPVHDNTIDERLRKEDRHGD